MWNNNVNYNNSIVQLKFFTRFCVLLAFYKNKNLNIRLSYFKLHWPLFFQYDKKMYIKLAKKFIRSLFDKVKNIKTSLTFFKCYTNETFYLQIINYQTLQNCNQKSKTSYIQYTPNIII